MFFFLNKQLNDLIYNFDFDCNKDTPIIRPSPFLCFFKSSMEKWYRQRITLSNVLLAEMMIHNSSTFSIFARTTAQAFKGEKNWKYTQDTIYNHLCIHMPKKTNRTFEKRIKNRIKLLQGSSNKITRFYFENQNYRNSIKLF